MALDQLHKRKQRRIDYLAAFRSEHGRRVLSDLYGFCHMDQPSFAVDPHLTAFNEGKRRVFLRILGIMGMSEGDVERLARGDDDE